MVIVHLSDKQRRIISPEKDETLEDLFIRFCTEFGYERAQYEFQSYPHDSYVALDMLMNANRVKELRFVEIYDSRRCSIDSCYTTIHEAAAPAPMAVPHAHIVAPPRRKSWAPIVPESSEMIGPIADAGAVAVAVPSSSSSSSKLKLKKRSAPRPPVAVGGAVTVQVEDVRHSGPVTGSVPDPVTPDIDIPPPPAFRPAAGDSGAHLLSALPCRSVECATDEGPARCRPVVVLSDQRAHGNKTGDADNTDNEDEDESANTSPLHFPMAVPCASQETLESLDENFGGGGDDGPRPMRDRAAESNSSSSSVNDVYENERWVRITLGRDGGHDDDDDDGGDGDDDHDIGGAGEQHQAHSEQAPRAPSEIGVQSDRDAAILPVIGAVDTHISRPPPPPHIPATHARYPIPPVPITQNTDQDRRSSDARYPIPPPQNMDQDRRSSDARYPIPPPQNMDQDHRSSDARYPIPPPQNMDQDHRSSDARYPIPPVPITENTGQEDPVISANHSRTAHDQRDSYSQSRAKARTVDICSNINLLEESGARTARPADKHHGEERGPPQFWDVPKQSKTLHLLARATHSTIDNCESSDNCVTAPSPTPIGGHGDDSATDGPPSVLEPAPRPVRVIVQEMAPADLSGRPMYRPRQAKRLFFTAE